MDIRKLSGVHVIRLSGDLKLGDPVTKFRAAAEQLLGEGESRFIVDLADVRIVDSSGIGALVKVLTSAKKNGGDLKLVHPAPLVVQTLKMVGLIQLFEVFDDPNAAVASFQ